MNTKPFILMYHGVVDTGRGIETLIQLMSYNTELYAVIMGNGTEQYLKSLKDLAKSLSVEKRVLFLPAVEQTQIWEYAGAVDVEMMLLKNEASNHYYSLPNKFFESIQSLTPVAASFFPEMKRIIDYYDIGKTFNPENLDEINQCIESMRLDDNEYSKYKKNLKKAKEELCWEKESRILKKALIEKIGDKKKCRVVKLLLNDFSVASRDKREISVMKELDWDVRVMYPYDEKTGPYRGKYRYIRLRRKMITPAQNWFLRKVYILGNEISAIRQVRRLKCDVISCHDLGALRIAWIAFIGKKRPKLIYDAHEFEIGRYTAGQRGKIRGKIIAMQEKYLMKKVAFSIMVNDSIADETQRIHGLPERPVVIRSTPVYYEINEEICKKRRQEMLTYFAGM